MKKPTFFLASLGCAKNTVDSDSIAALLQRDGYRAVVQPGKADVLIVNTCGFIQQARDESIEVLRDLAESKKPNQMLIAAGCMTERYREKMLELVPGIDGIIGTRRWMDILELLTDMREKPRQPRYHIPESTTIGEDEKGLVRASIQGASAYLKIADGCRRPCAFCSIPLIKGTQVSRPLQAVLDDAMALQEQGIKELILISQDTTDYGSDLGLKDGLAVLLEALLPRIPEIPWVRVLYAYPGFVTERLIEVMASSPQILPYLDMPLQHAAPEMLLRMNRPANMDWVRSTIARLRGLLPGLALRTTFIAGFPGETEEEFQQLLDFIREIEFDHVGVFPYSFELGTRAEPLGDPVPEAVKAERVKELMLLQEGISLRRNQKMIGQVLDVLIEGEGDGISVGRSYRDAPEIDGLVLIEEPANVGEIVKVRITGAMTHDLAGFLEKKT